MRWAEVPDKWRRILLDDMRQRAAVGQKLAEEPEEDLGPHCRATIEFSKALLAAAKELDGSA